MKKRTLVCFLIFTLCVFYTAIPNTVFGQEEGVALAKQVFDEHSETLQRDDVKAQLPGILNSLQGAGDDVDIPDLIDLAITLVNSSGPAALQAVAETRGVTLTDDQAALLADADVQTLLTAETTKQLLGLKGVELQAGLAELLRLANEPTDDDDGDDGDDGDDDDGTTDDGTTDDGTTDDGTTDDGTTDDGTTDDGTTDDGTTDDGTTDDDTTPPGEDTLPPAELIMPTDDSLLGESKLGGLSLNRVDVRAIVDFIGESEGLTPEFVAMTLANFAPSGFFPKEQIERVLLDPAYPIFRQEGRPTEAKQLDYENFGNAITPNLADFAYNDYGKKPTAKYLTRDGLHLYVRVPAKLGEGAGVTFNLTGKVSGESSYPATEINPAEFQADTIPYTFRLEETLAAANLPAWASLDTQLFESVHLRWSKGLNAPIYESDEMFSETMENGGIIWEVTLDIPADRGNTFYYFEVVLAEELTFTTLDREAIEAINPITATLDDIWDDPNDPNDPHAITSRTIKKWSMPDPRNLQLVDRGIGAALLSDDLLGVLSQIDFSQALMGDISGLFTPKQSNDIRNILERNAIALISRFEEDYDPMVASVFSVPKVKLEEHSLWVKYISDLADDTYNLEAIVHDAEGNALDQIQEGFTVDTSAPEATIKINDMASGLNTTGYTNSEGVFVATAPEAGAAALSITADPTDPSDLGIAKGYLFYQMIGLNPDGTLYTDAASVKRPNTWMPLSVQSTMLTSTIWNAIREAISSGRVELPAALDDPNVQVALGLEPTVEEILDLLNGKIPERLKPLLAILKIDETNISDVLLNEANKNFASLEDFTGFSGINETQYQLLVDILGATVDIIDHLVPVTFDADQPVMMPIQGDGMPLWTGDYGIRAMGIDTLFNIGAHVNPTRLRIVAPEYDKASVTYAVIDDCNLDGDMDDLFESGPIGDVTIFKNTTDNVKLTVTVDHRTDHPASVMVQYMDDAGVWQNIGTPLDLDGTEAGSTLTIDWNVADFDDLVMAGSTVSVRAVAANELGLEDPNAVEGIINLDAGVCPLDPEVIAITLDPVPPTETNPDSGGRQGKLTLTAYTPSRTPTPISSVHLTAKGPQDAEWVIETSEVAEQVAGQQLADLLGDLVNTVGPDKPIVHVNSMYQKWMVEVDTTTLKDTITAESPAARDASTDENQYVVTGYAVAEFPAIPGVEARFSVDNVDDVAPLGPTNISVTSVEATDSVFETAEDGSYTVGGLVDKYDETVVSPMATLTIKPTADRKTYDSVRLVTDIENLVINEVTETESGVFEVTIDVGTLAGEEMMYLKNGTYMFHALAFDDADPVNEQEDISEISVTVENSYRPAPEILSITTDPAAETNPDSGAPKGIITLNSYTLGEKTSPPITSMDFEVKRQNDDDSAWQPLGTAEEGTVVASEDLEGLQQQNVDFLSDLLQVAAESAVESGEASPIHHQAYRKWTVDIDTVELGLEDTIDKDSPAARDASKDDNPYVVRTIAISAADEGETEPPDGVKSTFSLDNVDDVGPLGPTNIVAVSDILADGTEANIPANEDGSYSVGGIVDDTVVQHPVAIFTIKPTADPKTYASVKLVTDAEGAVIEEAMEIEEGVFKITVDVAEVPNGSYMFHALAFDDADPANVQEDMSETDGSREVVGVLNFRVSDVTDLGVTAVDGTDVPEPPAEPIPLRESVTVSFMVANGSLAAEELSGEVNGAMMPSESAEDPENTFSLKVEVAGLTDDGVYTPDGKVTKRNGSVEFPLTTVNLDRTGPMVTIESPTEDETVDSLPTIRATYHDGAGAGVDGATGSLALARLQPNEVEVVVDQADLEKDAESLVYTRSEPLAGGAYRVTVQVTDNLGNVGEGSAEFAVNGTAPTVAIHSPASGQTFEHGEPLISGEFSGAGTVEVATFTINDVDATPEVDGNRFSYTPEDALANGDYKVVVAVTDGDGNTAQTSVVFMVDIPEPPKDTTPPVISSVAPTGILKDANLDKLGAAVISAVVTDEQSAISSVKYSINGGLSRSVSNLNITEGKIEAPVDFETHGPGLYTVRLIATSQGGTTEHTWTFTLVVDNVKPTITSITPSGTFRGGLPVISASASDDSGVGEMSIIVMDSEGEEVEGNTEDDGEDGVEGITRLDFNPEEPLDEGTYTIEVRATDTLGNSATAKGNFTIDFDTAAPVITVASPHQNARLKLKPGEKAPTVSIAYADPESGINVDSVTLVIEGAASKYSATPSGTKITLTPEQKSASQVMYPLSLDTAAKPETWAGEYVVRFEVADNADQEGNVSAKNKGAREANRTVHTFSFFLEAAEGPILAARPLNYPNPFKDDTRISFSLARQATVSIVIYDATLRPVRVLVDNRVFDAGNYTRKDNGSDAIGWDGTSSGGEDLARGIYFCEIIVADGFEPEYAILKLALTR